MSSLGLSGWAGTEQGQLGVPAPQPPQFLHVHYVPRAPQVEGNKNLKGLLS